MRRPIAALLALSIVGLALVACGPTPRREWPISTYGDIYNNLSFQPGSR